MAPADGSGEGQPAEELFGAGGELKSACEELLKYKVSERTERTKLWRHHGWYDPEMDADYVLVGEYLLDAFGDEVSVRYEVRQMIEQGEATYRLDTWGFDPQASLGDYVWEIMESEVKPDLLTGPKTMGRRRVGGRSDSTTNPELAGVLKYLLIRAKDCPTARPFTKEY